jgi:hypothetical protein
MLGTPMLRATLLLIITIIPMSPLWHIRVAKISHYGELRGQHLMNDYFSS